MSASSNENENAEIEILRSLEKDVIKNHLDIIFLLRIKSKNALSGYDLLEYVNDKYEIILSPGTVYAQLYCLERKCLIEGKLHSSGKRTYSLTSQGTKTIDTILFSKERIQKVIASVFEEQANV